MCVGGGQVDLTLLRTHGRCPEKKHSRGLVFNRRFQVVQGRAGLWKWDTTEIKYKNTLPTTPPLPPPNSLGASKPELGTARLFLWFDPVAQSLPPTPVSPRCPPLVASAGCPALSPSPPGRAGWASQGHVLGFFFGGVGGRHTGMLGQGHGEGTEGSAPGGGGEGSTARQGVSTERALFFGRSYKNRVI